MTDNPNIVPEEPNSLVETVSPLDPPLSEEELPSAEDRNEAEKQWADEIPIADEDDDDADLDQPGPPIQIVPSDSPGG